MRPEVLSVGDLQVEPGAVRLARMDPGQVRLGGGDTHEVGMALAGEQRETGVADRAVATHAAGVEDRLHIGRIIQGTGRLFAGLGGQRVDGRDLQRLLGAGRPAR